MHTTRSPAEITSAADMFTLSDRTTWSCDQPIASATAVWTNDAWQAVEARAFLYDGWNLVAETIQNQQSQITNHYVWGLDLSGTLQGAGGIGGLLAATFGGTTSVSSALYCYDVNGNVGQLVGPDDDLLAHYEYSPFGEMVVSTGPLAKANPIRFSTKHWDDLTGLGYWGYRYYHPDMGRWLSRDPIEERGGCSLYCFIGNDVEGAVDFLGLSDSLSWQSYSLQGCDPGWPFSIHTPSGNPHEETENSNTAKLRHECYLKGWAAGMSEGLCNTAQRKDNNPDYNASTRLEVHATNHGCCKRYEFSCRWSYTGTGRGGAETLGQVSVTTAWSGQRNHNFERWRYAYDHFATINMSEQTEVGQIDLPFGKTKMIPQIDPYIYAGDYVDSKLWEEGVVTCSGKCVDE